jgi:inorganic triphosphatase YgiF
MHFATNALVTKIRGEKVKESNTVDLKTHSVSQQSYGSLLLNFQNLINDLESLGGLYDPTNSTIKISNLLTIKNQAETANDKVTMAFASLTPKQDQRLDAFELLSSKAQRIKDLVQSQYGINSSEYKLVKGLSI